MARTDSRNLAMPVVTECDDSYLSDAGSFPLSAEDVEKALGDAVTGEVVEGVVGAGTGMACFDFKGGIGSASRRILAVNGGFTVGALVLTNFGSRPNLRVDGVRVGENIEDLMPVRHVEGSCIVIVATDAPMLPHQLSRLAKRAALGLARTGSIGANGSGELMIAFSTAHRADTTPAVTREVRALADGGYRDSAFNPIFEAAIEAVEESVLNALFTAETTAGRDGHLLHALPVDRTLDLLERAGRISE
jgi:D-aminopeptidase